MEAPDDNAPNVDLLLDVSLGDIDGIAACRMIKSTPHLQDLPIIMVTGRTEVEVLYAAFDAGATDYIAKPVIKLELMARVRTALKLKQEMDRHKAREHELLKVTQQLVAVNQQLEQLVSVDALTHVASGRQFDLTLRSAWGRQFSQETFRRCYFAHLG